MGLRAKVYVRGLRASQNAHTFFANGGYKKDYTILSYMIGSKSHNKGHILLACAVLSASCAGKLREQTAKRQC
jgi:hypothetical protein